MAGRKARSVRRREWEQRLARWGRSRQTVKEFCLAEGVSVPALYQWRKRLGASAQSRSKAAVVRRGRKASEIIGPVFKPVRIVGPGQASGVTIRLPSGVVVELGPDRHVIEQVIGQLLAHQVQ